MLIRTSIVSIPMFSESPLLFVADKACKIRFAKKITEHTNSSFEGERADEVACIISAKLVNSRAVYKVKYRSVPNHPISSLWKTFKIPNAKLCTTITLSTKPGLVFPFIAKTPPAIIGTKNDSRRKNKKRLSNF